MNFYQKIYGFATIVILAITAIILFICIDAPYSGKFIAGGIAVCISEFMIGIFSMLVSGRSDRIMFHSVGYVTSSILYFFFTLCMTCFINSELLLKKYIAIETIGFLLFVFIILFFYMSEHNINEQDTKNGKNQRERSNFINMMMQIASAAEETFSDNTKLLQLVRQTVEDFRYRADSSEKTASLDSEVVKSLDILHQNLVEKDRELFLKELSHLRNILKLINEEK